MVSILLDTQFFYDRGFSFDNRELEQLVDLVDDCKVEVFLTKVIDGEVKAGITRRLTEGHAELKTVIKKHADLRHFQLATKELRQDASRDKIVEKRLKAWEDFKEAVEADLLDTNDVPVDDILEAYFNNTPPFGKADKKAEFPDAITLAAAKSWAKKNGDLHIVSRDSDVEAYCENLTNLIHHDTLAEVLEPFNDEVITASVQKSLREQVPEYKAFLNDYSDLLNFIAEDEDTEDVEISDIAISGCELVDQPTVISAEDGKGVAEVKVRFDYTANLSRPDVNSWFSDREDKLSGYFANESAKATGSDTVTLTVEFIYDEEDPSDVTILGLEADDETREIDLGTVMFEREDDFSE